MAEYEVRLPPSKLCLKITRGMKKSSEKLGAIITGDIVTVLAVIGDRANIVSPIKGWCSMKNEEKNLKYLYKTRKTVIDATETTCCLTKKALELSRKDYCQRNISEIENHMQVIRNQREASGRADDMKATMNELQERKEMLEELLHPKLKWNCSQCTYLNSPAHFECTMCKSLKPAEITVAMSAKLQAALSNRKDDEKQITSLFSSVEEEEPKPHIEKLERKVSELLEQHSEVSERLNELQDSNTLLGDRITEVETTLKTCVDLSAVDPKEWSVAMVSIWLLQLGFPMYQEDFKDALMDGEKLLSCNGVILEELDVRRKHRPVILGAIAELERKSKKFKVNSSLASPVQSQLTSDVGGTQNVQEFVSEKNLKVSSKSLQLDEPISYPSPAQESTDDFANFSDEDWEDNDGWDIVGEEI